MGKEGELSDDSALIDAFNNATSKYKKMSGKKTSEANVSVVVDKPVMRLKNTGMQERTAMLH